MGPMAVRVWLLLLAIGVFVSVACDSGVSGTPAAEGGVSGRAFAGPVCPVERPGDPACAPRPVAGAVIVVRDAAGSEVATATTDDEGRFAVALAPGRYTIEGMPVEGLMGNPTPIDVLVGDGLSAVELFYDTGIR
jgi:hypothetical protein